MSLAVLAAGIGSAFLTISCVSPTRDDASLARTRVRCSRGTDLACVARSRQPLCVPRNQLRCSRQERHGNGEIHYHVALVSEDDRNLRFGPIKDFIRAEHQLETHWSGHGGYCTAVAYGYVPSPRKPRKEMDPTPLRWARVGAFGATSLHSAMQ